jgi:ATP-dependent 26S proteasome regulatory subunit
MTLSPDVNLEEITQLTEGMTGAQIQAVCREAGMLAVRKSAFAVTHQDFLDAIHKVAGEEEEREERMFH